MLYKLISIQQPLSFHSVQSCDSICDSRFTGCLYNNVNSQTAFEPFACLYRLLVAFANSLNPAK